ncbi:MAG TPA: TonB-dependent receptor [Gammaproteobacteria bacterium]
MAGILGRNVRRGGVCALAAAVGFGGLAHAQEPSGAIEEVQVTGTRIQASGMTTPTPVTSVTAEELFTLAPGTMMDALNQLPQFLGNDTPESVAGWTGSAGQSLLNLRGIGAVRTLVLLDGRRVVPSTRRGTTDISVFPQALVRRTEVVTGGASAAYGSDAVSGVVNFVLDTEYEGFEGRVQGGMTDRSDNENVLASIAGGTSVGERGHIIMSAEYYKAKEVRWGPGNHDSGSRDWLEENWGIILIPDPNGPDRHIVPNVRSRTATFGGLITDGPLAGIQFNDAGQPVRFFDGTLINSNGTLQQGGSGDVNHSTLMPEQTRNTAFVHYKHELGESKEWYVQGLYGNSTVEYDKEPHHFSQGYPGNIEIFADNAFLPDVIRQRMIDEGIDSFTFAKTHTRDEGLPARVITDNRTTSFTTGFKGDFLDDWSFDVYYQWGRNKQDMTHKNNLRTDRYFRAIDSVIHPETGEIVCMSTLTNPNDGCIPFNPFGVHQNSLDAWQYVTGTQHQIQILRQDFFEGSVSGTPLDNWAGPVSFAAGASYRKDDLEQFGRPAELTQGAVNPDPVDVGYRPESLPRFYHGSGLFAYGTIPLVDGSYDVWEVFGESIVPLVADRGLARSLDLNAAIRYADYEGSGGVLAWKGGLDWQITDSVRLRLTRSRDVRAATLSERYAQTPRGATVTDPFLPGEPRYSIRSVEGGNPTVEPEEADTVTFGIVYQPEALDGLNLSADYYDIKLNGAIDLLGVQEIMDQCFAGATSLCDRITREAGPGTDVIQIDNTYLNIAESRTRGVDLEATYSFPLGLRLRTLVSYIAEASITNPGAPKLDRAGQSDIAPEWNALASISYDHGPFSFTWTQRYIGSGVRDVDWVTGVDIDDNRVPARMYTNLRASYNADTYEIYANVVNLFDREPPHVVGGSLYSDLGRSYAVGVRFSY